MIKKIRKKFKKVNSQKGFTLLEILVVLTIMGFLIAMVAPRLEATSARMTDAADLLSSVITDNDALEDGLQITGMAYDDEPVDPYIIANNDDKERGRNNFPNYASQLQATFARFQITKISK